MLARFEKLVEQAVEGSLRRVFPTTVQPVQLAKAAARAMEDAQVIGLHGAEVPNKYELQLAPDDLERFGDYASTLCDEVSRYLADYARDRGLRLVAEPRVELQPDVDVRAGSVRAQARFVDLAPPARREIDAAVEGTRRLRLADLAEARAASPAVTERGMWLEDRLGLRAPLDSQMGIVLVALLYLFLASVMRMAASGLRPRRTRGVEPVPVPVPVLRLVVVESGSSDLVPGQAVELKDAAILGRAERADVVLADPAVS